ncbi:hypothetical protein NEAUS04_2325 [Nematocida ausubeli]|nr:hypothetical protein NEAUS04_2325 [Nematocida ausubeli]
MKLNIKKRNPVEQQEKEIVGKGRKRDASQTIAWLLIHLAGLCQVWGRMTPDELKTIQTTEVAVGFNRRVVVNPDSVLNPLHGRVINNIRLMHNKRFIAPEIKIKYAITAKKANALYPIYMYARDSRLDRVRDDSDLAYKGRLLKYKKEYFNTLLELFPSIYGYVSIWSDREDSFFSFINRADVKEYKYKILASLLLLTEGVDVPLTANRTELVLKKVGCSKVHFRLRTQTVESDNPKDRHPPRRKLELENSAVVGVVNFFIKNRKNEILKAEGYTVEPANYEEFKKGEFMNSPGFLIQTYIYHCVESTEKMILFIQTVYDLLSEYMAQNEAGSGIEAPEELSTEKTLAKQVKDVFDHYFVQTSRSQVGLQYIDIALQAEVPLCNHGVDYWGELLHLELANDLLPTRKPMNSLRLLSSFVLDVNLPNDRPVYYGDILIPFSEFIDCGETALLGLFCWAAYDCRKNIYTADHIKSASEKLKSFFQKHWSMYGNVSKEMHDEWNQVVMHLQSTNVRYLRSDENQVGPGIVNLMYAAAKIAGIDEMPEVEGFKRKIEEIRDERTTDKVRRLSMKHSKKNISGKEKKKMEEEIRKLIDAKEQAQLKNLILKLKCAGRQEENSIQLEIKRLEDEIDKRNTTDLDFLVLCYMEKEDRLKEAISRDIEACLCGLVKKIALDKNIDVKMSRAYKETLIHGYSDIFGQIEISYNLNGAHEVNRMHAHPYTYRFRIVPKYKSDSEDEPHWYGKFKISRSKSTEATRQIACSFQWLQIIPRVTEKSFIMWMLNFYIDNSEQIDMFCIALSPYKAHDLIEKAIGDNKKRINIDMILLDPLVHNRRHIRNTVHALLIYGIVARLGSSSALRCLADNVMGSSLFIEKKQQNAMFIPFSVITVPKHYPHVRIDESVYEKTHSFLYALKNTLASVDISSSIGSTLLPVIITNLMVQFRKTCLENSYYSTLQRFARMLSNRERSLFFDILIQQKKTMKNIEIVVRAMREVEKTHPSTAFGCHSNEFLIWIIGLACSKHRINFAYNIIKGCYDLIDLECPERTRFGGHYSKWKAHFQSEVLLGRIKDIVCVESNEESIERFELIYRLLT